MSTIDTPYLENEHLRDIIERVPNHRQRAADLLWTFAEKETADLKCLIKHVPRYAERAALELVNKPEVYLTDLDVIFEQITSIQIRILTGRAILDRENGYNRYSKVINEVPELRAEALSLLLDVGPDDHWDLHAIWEFADPSVRTAQWEKYCQTERYNTWLLNIIQEDRYHDLTLLAFEESKKTWEWKDTGIWDYQLHYLLGCPSIQHQTWDWIVAIDKMKFGLALDITIKHEALRDKAWEWLKSASKKGNWAMNLFNMATYDKNPAWLQEKAAREALATASTPWQLSSLTCVYSARDEAARRLLDDFQIKPAE